MADDRKPKEGEGAATEEPGEAFMFELMKEMFAFGYSAAERMEERAAEFGKMRKERMAEFRKDVEQMDDKVRGTFEERTGEFRGKVRKEVMNAMRETGVATQAELDEIKGMISDLADKLDKAQGPKTDKAK